MKLSRNKISEYQSSNGYIRINYKTINNSSHGYYIMKKSFYEDNKNRIIKLLKNCLIEIILNYC